MNGRIAKRLRRRHLGDYSIRYRKYAQGKGEARIDVGPYGRYRKAKKQYRPGQKI